MSGARPWRWGFLGASRIGRSALGPAIAALPGHALAAVASRDPACAASYAAECGFARAHASYESLLADPDIDAVYIALTNDAHLPWTVRALEAGKHVLCEKPLALNAAEVGRMRAAERGAGARGAGARGAGAVGAGERGAGARAMEAFCHIHHPQIALARALLAQGAIGRVIALQASVGAAIANPADFRWAARMGGGALFDIGTYCVSAFRVLLGREPVSAAGVRKLRGDVDLDTAAQLDFGDGVAAQFVCSFDRPRSAVLEIFGSAGRLRLDRPFSTKGHATTLWHDAARIELPAVDPYRLMVLDFARAIETDCPMLHGLDASWHQAAAMDAIAASCASSQVTPIG